MSCDLSSKFTTSQASAAGLWPCDGQGGSAPSGPHHARANRSRQRGSGKRKPTTGTCGLFSEPSSPSADLQRSLESRLRAALAGRGSPEYVLTWKRWDIGSGVPICALRASGHRTSASGFGGWPTPMAGTPARNGNSAAGNTDSSRAIVAMFAGWPTPKAMEDNRTTEQYLSFKGKHGASNISGLQVLVRMAGWNTPRATDGTHGGPNQTGGALPADAARAGIGSTSSLVATARRGALNPALPRWLMGFPNAWCESAVTAMRSSRKSRRRS
jgi:hypothetical protein